MARPWGGSDDNVKMVVPPPQGHLETVALISTCSKIWFLISVLDFLHK